MTVVMTKAGMRSLAKSWPGAGVESRWRGSSSPTEIALLGTGGSKTFVEMYRAQPWVRVCVDKIARAIARLPLKAFLLDPDTGNRDRVRDHPLAQLIRVPHAGGSRYSLVEAVCGSLGIHGNSLVVKGAVQVGAPTSELWPLDWRQVSVVAGERQPIDHYLYRAAHGTKVFMPDEVLHFRFMSPDGLTGVSPLETLARTLQLEDAGQRYAVASFRNALRPAGFLKTENQLTPEQRSSLTASLNAQHGGIDRAFSLALLTGGLSWEAATHTAQEAETIAHRKLNREEVAAVYQIDPTQIGILDRATFSNVEEAHLGFYMDTLGPWVAMIEDTFMSQLIQPELSFADTFLEFDMSDVLKGNITMRSEAYQRFVSIYTPNELRRLENLPAIDDRGADSIWMPMNHVALDGRLPSNPDTPVGTPALARNGNTPELVRR